MDKINSLSLPKSLEIREPKTKSLQKYHNFQGGNVERTVNVR